MKPKLTPEEKADKIRLDQWKYISNVVKGAWSFGHIKTYRDLRHCASLSIKGYFPSELDRKVTFDDVKELLSDLKIAIDTEIWLRKNPPVLTNTDIVLQLPSAAVIVAEPSPIPPDKIITLDETKKDYGLPPCKREKCYLFWFQKKYAKIMLDAILRGDRAAYLVAPAGSGKTFIMGAVIARLIEMGWQSDRCLSPWPYVYVTKASVVEQTKRVFQQNWGLTEDDCLVIGIDQMRSQFGKRFVREEIKIKDGEEKCQWIWRRNLKPIFMGIDEGHAVKNVWSKQSQIFQSYNESCSDDEHNFQCFISATPGTKVAEFKCFSVATRVPYSFGVDKNAPLTNERWNDFARNIASNYGESDTTPEEHCPAAVDRLMDYLDKYIIRVKGIKPQFRAKNTINLISFLTKEGREFYDSAIERFLKKKNEIESDDEMSEGQKNINLLVALLVFRIAAESNPDRVKYIAKAMYESVTYHNQAAVAALNFKVSIVKIVDCLVNDYGVARDRISLIWGGAPTENEKQKKKKKITSSEEFMKAMEEEGMTLEDFDLDEVEDVIEVDDSLKLKPQNAKQRQEEIDKFQAGKSLYCLYTFRAGGVGLSLHHTDELTKEKVRHKESGYAVEEDIPKIPTRQRINFVAPTYSAIELVQGLGRCPRLTSLSETPQVLLFFHGTIEEKVAAIVSMKLRCLTKVVRQREDWQDVAICSYSDEEIKQKHLTDIEPELEDDVLVESESDE